MLNIDQIFEALGRIGRNAYILASQAQDIQETPFNQLSGFAYINPAWITSLTSSYDSLIRQETSGMGIWAQTAQTILMQLVAAENPVYGTSLPASLQFLYQEMIAQAETVLRYTVGSSVTPDTANVGSGEVFVTLIRSDGIQFQNVIPEAGTIFITADSFTGGATAGREPWTWVGVPNLSSLGTGIPVGQWDWDWPQGSGTSASGSCIAASDQANTGGNFLTNGDFELWTGSAPAVLDNWKLVVGTWGTTIEREATEVLGGTYSIQFNTGATLNELTQQFDSSVSDGTDATAGTPAALDAYSGYAFNLWLKAAGVISGGVMTVSLVDSANTVINDQQGVANTNTIALTGHSTSWTAHSFAFRTPVILPTNGIVRLRIAITTALAGANLYLDQAAWAVPTSLYAGGANVCIFSNPSDLYEAAPDPDAYTITLTNNYGGATFGASFQTLFSRLFGTPGLILPNAVAPPTQLDTLITAP